MPTRYVAEDTVKFYNDQGKSFMELLWGDRVEVIQQASPRSKVKARGRVGHVNNDALGDTSLLEVYFIDVGQGDGVLIRTPDDRHVLIDGGYKRAAQPTGKNAADFVDWKFARDYGRNKITLDAMIASHCDADHYGGLWDLVNPNESDQLDLQTMPDVAAFYHAGVGWWREPGHTRWLGKETDGMLVQLLGDRQSIGAALQGSGPRAQGEWGEFLKCVFDLNCPVARLSHKTGHVPGFAPAPGKASIKVLGPYEHQVQGKPGLRSYGSDSQDSNGNSILLRLDFGRVRILLTGDLNLKSQQALLADYTGLRQELACDVAKACHHGSDDCSYEFLSVLGAACTVISSGDNEGHAHPRPSIVAASAQTGHTRIVNDRVVTPLVYSTEIARSVRLGEPTVVHATVNGAPAAIPVPGTKLEFREKRVGDLNPTTATRDFDDLLVVPGIIYGLVNVRTDGNRILCATLNEKSSTWDVKTFESRF